MSARVHVVTGKGGVGKTAVAAGLALAEAARGRNVLVAEVKGGDRVPALLEVAPVGSHMREVLPRVWAVDMNPDDAIHEYVLLTLRFERVYRAVFENRLVRGFIRLVPSLAEMVMLGKLWYHEQEKVRGRPRFDTLILDAPATGHALALLRTPTAVQTTVPGGPLMQIARDLQAMLSDPDRTRLHVVMTPEEMPVTEALEIERAAAGDLHMALGAAVINQRLVPLPDHALTRIEPLAADRTLEGSVEALARREVKRDAGEAELRRLPAAMRDGAVSLPRLVGPSFGRAEIERLASFLAPAVAP